MADFRGYVTAAGQTFEALAKKMGYPVTIGFIEVGDGKLPDSESPIDRTQLVHKLKQFPAIVEQDAKNPGQWVATCYIPADDAIDGAGYFIREIGCKLINQGNGVLYAYRRVSDDWKPVITSGEAKSFIYKLRFIPSNGELLTPTIDPSVVLVDKEELARVMEAHVESLNHPDATEIEKGFSRHATQHEVNNNEPSSTSSQAVVTVDKLWGWAEQSGAKFPYALSLWKRSLAESGYELVGIFGAKAKIENHRQVMISANGTDAYEWQGEIPKDVTEDENPTQEGQWNRITDVYLREELSGRLGAELIQTRRGISAEVAIALSCSGVFTPYGGQLKSLGAALLDPLHQELQITFIGDSITWGTGASGQSISSLPRDKTLSDPRNNATSPSFVNEFGRWVSGLLGDDAVVTLSNHEYSQSGESIRTVKSDKYEFPVGAPYKISGTGTFSDAISTNQSGPYLGAKRKLAIFDGGTVSLSFRFTGSEFTLIYSQIDRSADYELLVNGNSHGVFKTSGDATYNVRRKHEFPFVKDGVITIRVQKAPDDPPSIYQELGIEGILIPKTIRIKNQGISGITTERYILYNFPEGVTSIDAKIPSEIPSFTATPIGPGATSFVAKESASSVRGMRFDYGFLVNSKWDISVSPPSTSDEIILYYASNNGTCAVNVKADGNVIDTFNTNSITSGESVGFAKSHKIRFPKGTSTITFETIYTPRPNGDVCYLIMEGIQFADSESIDYPDNNKFNDGVALDIKDSFAFIQLGINDRGDKLKSPAQTRWQLERMLNLLPPKCEPILMCPNPAIENANYDTFDVMHAIRKAASELSVDFINNHELFSGFSLSDFTKDNLHPNDFGHKMIFNNIKMSVISG